MLSHPELNTYHLQKTEGEKLLAGKSQEQADT